MKEQEDTKFQRAIIVSAILHLVLLGVFILGVPSMFEKLPEEPDVITFEIVSMSDIVNIKTENIVAKKAIDPEKSKEVKEKYFDNFKDQQDLSYSLEDNYHISELNPGDITYDSRFIWLP